MLVTQQVVGAKKLNGILSGPWDSIKSLCSIFVYSNVGRNWPMHLNKIQQLITIYPASSRTFELRVSALWGCNVRFNQLPPRRRVAGYGTTLDIVNYISDKVSLGKNQGGYQDLEIGLALV